MLGCFSEQNTVRNDIVGIEMILMITAFGVFKVGG